MFPPPLWIYIHYYCNEFIFIIVFKAFGRIRMQGAGLEPAKALSHMVLSIARNDLSLHAP